MSPAEANSTPTREASAPAPRPAADPAPEPRAEPPAAPAPVPAGRERSGSLVQAQISLFEARASGPSRLSPNPKGNFWTAVPPSESSETEVWNIWEGASRRSSNDSGDGDQSPPAERSGAPPSRAQEVPRIIKQAPPLLSP